MVGSLRSLLCLLCTEAFNLLKLLLSLAKFLCSLLLDFLFLLPKLVCSHLLLDYDLLETVDTPVEHSVAQDAFEARVSKHVEVVADGLVRLLRVHEVFTVRLIRFLFKSVPRKLHSRAINDNTLVQRLTRHNVL